MKHLLWLLALLSLTMVTGCSTDTPPDPGVNQEEQIYAPSPEDETPVLETEDLENESPESSEPEGMDMDEASTGDSSEEAINSDLDSDETVVQEETVVEETSTEETSTEDTSTEETSTSASDGTTQVTETSDTTETEIEEVEETITMGKTIQIAVNGETMTATMEDNSSVDAFMDLLADGPLTIDMSDYGNMEKVGGIGSNLPTNDKQTTTSAGDIILYQGSALVIYYDVNSWSFTRLGKIDHLDQAGLKKILGKGSVSVTISLP